MNGEEALAVKALDDKTLVEKIPAEEDPAKKAHSEEAQVIEAQVEEAQEEELLAIRIANAQGCIEYLYHLSSQNFTLSFKKILKKAFKEFWSANTESLQQRRLEFIINTTATFTVNRTTVAAGEASEFKLNTDGFSKEIDKELLVKSFNLLTKHLTGTANANAVAIDDISKGFERLQLNERADFDAIFQIQCMGCQKLYIGETGKTVASHISKLIKGPSAVSKHIEESKETKSKDQSCRFDGNYRILSRTSDATLRKFQKSVHVNIRLGRKAVLNEKTKRLIVFAD